jgi:predicted 2-oxoglutarate/Fe(II)-dependent dioxygenase YbiX
MASRKSPPSKSQSKTKSRSAKISHPPKAPVAPVLPQVEVLRGTEGPLRTYLSQPFTPMAHDSYKPKDPLGYRNVLIRSNVIDKDMCKLLCSYADQRKKEQLAVVDYRGDDKPLEDAFDKSVRNTDYVNFGDEEHQILEEIFFNIMIEHIEPFFSKRVDWWEQPQVLSYPKGGKYEPHVDAEYWVTNEKGVAGWKKIMDRDISVLLYLNDEFKGGMLSFPEYNIRIKPAPGLLVAFPSSCDYLHGAEPTLSGKRYVVVTWISALGVPKVRPEPPDFPVIYMRDMLAKK